MEREVEMRLCIAAERIGTGLLRTGAAMERIAATLDKQADATSQCRCQGHAHNALANRHPAPNGYCMQCPCTQPPTQSTRREGSTDA